MFSWLVKTILWSVMTFGVVNSAKAEAGDPLEAAREIAIAGMNAQSQRLQLAAENLANERTVSEMPGGDPYRRKTVIFRNKKNRELGIDTVQVERYGEDKTPFKKEYDEGHPSADEQGFVKYPNVNRIIEKADADEAMLSYHANLNVFDIAKSMTLQTLNILQ